MFMRLEPGVSHPNIHVREISPDEKIEDLFSKKKFEEVHLFASPLPPQPSQAAHSTPLPGGSSPLG